MVAVTIDSIIEGDPGDGINANQSALIVEGGLTLSGNYGWGSPVVDGDIIDWTASPNAARLTSGRAPRNILIFQAPDAADDPVSYGFLYGYGTGQNDGVLKVIDLTTGSAIATGAYPAALTTPAPVIRYRAEFPKFI